MGAQGPTGAAHSRTETPDRVIGKISDVRGRETERGGAKKKNSEPLINILISASHVPCVLYL